MLCVKSSMMYGTPNNINHSGTLFTSALAGWHIQCSHAYGDLMGNKFSSIGLPESDLSGRSMQKLSRVTVSHNARQTTIPRTPVT
jgi:hypothetical protein